MYFLISPPPCTAPTPPISTLFWSSVINNYYIYIWIFQYHQHNHQTIIQGIIFPLKVENLCISQSNQTSRCPTQFVTQNWYIWFLQINYNLSTSEKKIFGQMSIHFVDFLFSNCFPVLARLSLKHQHHSLCKRI